jgi:hypothetical protein
MAKAMSDFFMMYFLDSVETDPMTSESGHQPTVGARIGWVSVATGEQFQRRQGDPECPGVGRAWLGRKLGCRRPIGGAKARIPSGDARPRSPDWTGERGMKADATQVMLFVKAWCFSLFYWQRAMRADLTQPVLNFVFEASPDDQEHAGPCATRR